MKIQNKVGFNAKTGIDLKLQLGVGATNNSLCGDKCFGFSMVATQAFCRAIQLEAVSHSESNNCKFSASAALQLVTIHVVQPLSFERQFVTLHKATHCPCLKKIIGDMNVSYGSQNYFSEMLT